VGRAVLGSLAAPASVAGTGPGAAEIAVSPDSRYAFVTLEGAGAVAVFDLAAAARGRFGSTAFIGAVPVGAGALGIATSADGRWLYEVSESGRVGTGPGNGVINVIDLRRAVDHPPSAVVSTAAAPCAPVRVAVSPDGAIAWVTARDGNSLLGYSTSALRTDSRRALVSVSRVGEQPLGLAVVDGGAMVLVADSNLSGSRSHSTGVSVVDIRSPSNPKLVGSTPAGKLTDAISAPPSATTALVTDSASRQVDVISTTHTP
jgi:DNA-binding beta-propeller fold protein YncE